MSAVDYRMTNFDKVAFIGGLYVGRPTAEVLVFNSSGAFVGTISQSSYAAANGTVAAPAFNFGGGTGGATTGFYAAGASNPAVSVGGALVQDWSGSTTTDTTTNFYARNTSNALIGTVSVYQSTAGDPGTLRLDLLAAASKNAYIQFRESGSSNVFAMGCDAGGATLKIKKSSPIGSAIISITQAGAISLTNGTVSLPSISFGLGTGGAGTGSYASATNTYAWATAGINAGQISSGQRWTIGSAVTEAQVHTINSIDTASSLGAHLNLSMGAAANLTYVIAKDRNDGALQLSGGGSGATGSFIKLTGHTFSTPDDLQLGSAASGIGFRITAGQIGFFGVTPVSRLPAYTITNDTTDRAYDANATTVDELADVVATLYRDLKTMGIFT